MTILGTGAAQLDILFQINSVRTLVFDFGIDVSAWTFEFYVKTNKGARIKALSLTSGSGISFVTYSTSQVQVSLSTTNTNLNEAEYYYELRRTDVAVPIVNGRAVFSYDAPQGTDQTQSLAFSYSAASVSLSVYSVTTLTDAGILFSDITTNNSSTSKHGFLPKLDGSTSHFLNGNGQWVTLAAIQQTLTDGATINWDVSAGEYAKVTLGGNRTIANPTNTVNGGFYILEIIQDATGSRTLSWGSNFVWSGGTAPTLTTTINKRDFIGFICSNGKLYGNSILNFA